jgi:hypothetical protein
MLRVTQAIGVLMMALVALGFWSYNGSADITGNFQVNITVQPIPCGALPFVSFTPPAVYPVNCENTLTKTDIETEINVNWTVSGLTLGLHAHTGLTGIEDVITTLKATLGALNIVDQFVFAVPFAMTSTLITNPSGPQSHSQPAITVINPGDLLFVKKRVDISTSFAGFLLDNLAIIEDVNFPQTMSTTVTSYTTANQLFRFGDLITLSGQTVSGISMAAQTGICISQKPNGLKKHNFPFSVADCSALLFSFENLSVTSIPLGPGLTGNLTVSCTQVISCQYTASFTFANAPIFSSIASSITFGTPAGPFTLNGATVILSSGPLTLTLSFNSLFQVSAVGVYANLTINPDSNPATLLINASSIPGTGFTSASTTLQVSRSGVTVSATAAFGSTSGGGLAFSSLTLKAATQVGPVQLGGNASFLPAGFGGVTLQVGVNF